MADSAQDNKVTLTKTIQRLMVILGPDITLMKVKHIEGIKVADDGTVTELAGDPKVVQQQLHDQLTELSSNLEKMLTSEQPAEIAEENKL